MSVLVLLAVTCAGSAQPVAEAAELVFNHDSNALPTVGGEAVNFSYPNVYESPTLFSEYDSGIVTIRRGDERLKLDFNRAKRTRN